MRIFNIIIIAIGLSMDAFAVAVSNGLKYKKQGIRVFVFTAIAFGVFQGLMPMLGWGVSCAFSDILNTVPHWIALMILSFLGIKMIVEALKNEDLTYTKQKLDLKLLIIQAIATSIDALAVGVSFSGFHMDLPETTFAALIIAAITVVLCFIGCIIGKITGSFLQEKAEIFGGVILILIGLKIFFECVFGRV